MKRKSITRPITFFLATRAFVLLTIVALLAFVWLFVSGQWLQSAVITLLWLLAAVVWVEWRNS